jgi:hypothetical protein
MSDPEQSLPWWKRPLLAGFYRRLDADVAYAIDRNIFSQCFLLLFAGLNLDGGESLIWVVMALVAWFAGVAAIVFRRPKSPSFADIFFARFGFAILLFISVASTPYHGWLLRLLR